MTVQTRIRANIGHGRSRKGWLCGVAGVAAALLLAGCTSSSNSPAGGGSSAAPASGSSSAAATGDGVSAAQAVVDKLSKPWGEIAAPGSSVDGSKLKGKTIAYVAINYKVPLFHTVYGAISEALKPFGVKVTACDAQSNPSSAVQCITSASDQNVAAVVLDSVAPPLVSNALAALKAKHIPVIMNDLNTPPSPNDDTLSYVVGDKDTDPSAWGRHNADAIIADSKGKADVLYIDLTTSPQTHQAITAARAEMSKLCADCKVTVKSATTVNQPQGASLVSAALLSDPKINYIGVVDSFLPGMKQGLQNANALNKVKLVTLTGVLAGLQDLDSGSLLAADVGDDPYFMGWACADEAIRMVTGQAPVQNYVLPQRVFTKENVKTLTLTPAAEATGEWYGGGNFKAMFHKLWGLSV